MVILLILIIGTTNGYDLKCPAQAEWRLRANTSCYSEDKYVCLFQILENKYEENCLGSDQSSIGSKLVFQPLFNLAECNNDTYQPIVFTTHGNSECILLKSNCDEEGQVVYSNDSSSKDITCRCDYTKGYAFVSKPKNSCFCNPSEEDCSCFRDNCNILSPDYQCILEEDTKANITCQEIYSHISHNKHNRTVQFIESIESNKKRYEVSFIIIILTAVYTVISVTTVFVLSKILSQTTTTISDEDKQKNIYELFSKNECGKHYFARVAFIGKEGVGKTSLMRRLLWQKKKEVTSPDSTDGIEIEKCNINVKNGKWSPCEKIHDDLDRLISQVYARKNKKVESLSGKHIRETVVDGEHSSNYTEKSHNDLEGDCEQQEINLSLTQIAEVSSLLSHDESEDINPKETIHEETNNESSDCEEKSVTETTNATVYPANKVQLDNIRFENPNTYLIDREIHNSNESEYEHGSEENIEEMTSAIIQPFLYQKESKIQDMLASCWLWDFAGQKEFYATHQVFLSSVAVFVLVTDSLECTTGETAWKGFDESASYVRFWIDVIHCYWSSRETEGRLDPPIIVVCTNTDKYEDKSERQKQQKRFIEYLCEVLFNQEKKDHLRKVYFVSNTDDSDDVFETIRKDISRQAMGKLKDSGVPISTTAKLFKISMHEGIGITTEEEFKSCLQYCHDNGTVIYFDEESLTDHVILDPKWLVDAFRCLVSDKMEFNSSLADDWHKLYEYGELTDSLIYHLFNKDKKRNFSKNKTHLLEVMKRFDIIVNLKNSTVLYMPCMMKSCSVEDVKKQLIGDSQSIRKTSWLCLEFEFLPPAFFNHILVWYIKQFSVTVILKKETRYERKALYRQIGVFDLDSSRCEQLVVCEGPNVIALQIWSSRMPNRTYGDFKTNLRQFIDTLRNRYRLKIAYKETFKCKDGDFTIHRESMDHLLTEKYRCVEHKINHTSDDLVNPWGLSAQLHQSRLSRQPSLSRPPSYNWDVKELNDEQATCVNETTQTDEILENDDYNANEETAENRFVIQQNADSDACPFCLCKPCITDETTGTFNLLVIQTRMKTSDNKNLSVSSTEITRENNEQSAISVRRYIYFLIKMIVELKVKLVVELEAVSVIELVVVFQVELLVELDVVLVVELVVD
ncbi:unnamed protein product [Mytilus coruscus]|uniref:COR domain-containing protein n=1 Tax=Mytilus coruscus TaxID=42192 RepID=A0A6J8D7S3_MYTCO|nr:unnamed protein product [Mytilus coruscus]